MDVAKFSRLLRTLAARLGLSSKVAPAAHVIAPDQDTRNRLEGIEQRALARLRRRCEDEARSRGISPSEVLQEWQRLDETDAP
jgi:hypothetical protein